MNKYIFLIVLTFAVLCNFCTSDSGIANVPVSLDESIQIFETELDQLRKKNRIPGLSVAVLHGEEILLSKGYGYADVEKKIKATENTPYHIASITKTFTSALIMQLVETGELDLDATLADVLAGTDFYFPGGTEHGFAEACSRLREWADDPSSPYSSILQEYHCDKYPITVRHHLTHTSEGVPGTNYRYSGALFSLLQYVVEAVSGSGFSDRLAEKIIDPLGLTSTIPGSNEAQRQSVYSMCAKSYIISSDGTPIRSVCESCAEVSASAGMASTVLDLAEYSISLDNNRIVSEESKQKMFTQNLSNDGQALPYGLGWFVQQSSAGKLVWHYGWQPDAYTSLILKVIDKDFTLILLANSDGLSASYNLGDGNVLNSPFAASFINIVAN